MFNRGLTENGQPSKFDMHETMKKADEESSDSSSAVRYLLKDIEMFSKTWYNTEKQ